MPFATSNTRSRFSLRAIFATTTALAVILIVAVQIPRAELTFAARTAPALVLFSTLFALLPLTCIHLACVAISKVLPAKLTQDARDRLHLLRPYQLVCQFAAAEPPTWFTCLLIAVASTLITALLWPLLRELGLGLALLIDKDFRDGWPTLNNIPSLLTNSSYLYRLCRWEMFALARWWCFFGALMAIWIAVTWPLRSRVRLEPISHTFRRLLAFAPWLVVLEIAFLIGVWTVEANVVPEPSTGFVEGVFAWNLWHWDCWKGAVWINRGLVPTFAIATIFYLYVLRWRWPPAIAAAACSVPPALILSVAWSVSFL